MSIFLCSFINKISHNGNADGDENIAYFVTVFLYLHKQLFFCFNAWHFAQVVANRRQDGVPDACAQSGVKDESAEFHPRQTCRDGNQLANGWYQSANEGG